MNGNDIIKASKKRFDEFVHDYPKHNNQQKRRLFMFIFRLGAEWALEQLVHKPDNLEGITSEELAHQFYGARYGKQLAIENACEYLYGSLNRGEIEVKDMESFIKDFKRTLEDKL